VPSEPSSNAPGQAAQPEPWSANLHYHQVILDVLPAGCERALDVGCGQGSSGLYGELDVNCKAHELDNLYVADTSFFPSIGAVNPALTVMANAIRVGEHLLERLT
jgi:hypothetical protein